MDDCFKFFGRILKNAALATRENEITGQFPVPRDNYLRFISSLRRVVLSPFP